MNNVTVTIELSPEAAAGLKRFADKISFEDATRVLYPHVNRATRSDQAYAILDAFRVLEKALLDAGVRDWPWIETGRV